MSGSEPSDSIDKSVQLPTMMPPTWWSATTARASAAPVTPTISSCASLSRVDMAASSAGPSPQAGGGTFSGAFGVAGAAAVVSGLGDGDAAGSPSAGEHANSSAGNAASAVPVCRSEATRVRLRDTSIRPWCHSARS